jgi:hypothetical protein
VVLLPVVLGSVVLGSVVLGSVVLRSVVLRSVVLGPVVLGSVVLGSVVLGSVVLRSVVLGPVVLGVLKGARSGVLGVLPVSEARSQLLVASELRVELMAAVQPSSLLQTLSLVSLLQPLQRVGRRLRPARLM